MGYIVLVVFLFFVYAIFATFFNLTFTSLIAGIAIGWLASYLYKKYFVPESYKDDELEDKISFVIGLGPGCLVAFSTPIWQPSIFCDSHPDVSKAPAFYDSDLNRCLEDIWSYGNFDIILLLLIVNFFILVYIIWLIYMRTKS